MAWLTLAHGWRAAFVATGAAGLGFAAVWWLVYRDPPDAATAGPGAPAPPLRALLGRRALWAVVAVRMLTDPVWYFYLVWFAKYLQERRGFSLADVGNALWVVFVAADVGCLAAGWAAGRLVRRGSAPVAARLAVMAGCAAVLVFGFAVPKLPDDRAALALASVCAGCVMAFLTCAVALPLDLFPASALGSVQGVIGTGGSLGGMVSTGVVAWAITHHSYDAVFAALSVLHPVGLLLLVVLLPRRPVLPEPT